MTAPGPDPAAAAETAERGAMPRVAPPRAGLSAMAIAILAILAAAILFSILDARRRALTAPAVRPARADVIGAPQALPPLYIPPVSYDAGAPPPDLLQNVEPTPRTAQARPAPVPPQPAPPQPMPPQTYAPPPEPAPPPRTSNGAILVIDGSQPATDRVTASGESGAPADPRDAASARSRAGAMSNRSTTVPQGTLIPAVLETALNSTGSGYARALVQRDVHGFDGRRVLVPRGSRLIGEYRSDTSPGQKRAFVTWTRLIRPDGVTIAIGSPATDPVGVGGMRAKVNSHFFERFAGSILQSAMLIGGNIAARSAGDSVVIALPGALPGASVTTPATQIPPTLSVRQGTSISVFVARDLDFTGVEAAQ
ncbi:TrbI/VirB10 family protein [Sphingopyxis granuli]|uniref:Conjugation TrbI family protein n=1 Tax=Sphingopyxis granuli TaxID=267128 RepID=A0AA86GK18_9SPHN|nr:TrbI/VirB10 family protein [Sphingopyxis granuli]AMG72872.1 Conjugation TrbI family protein [Sphingopyxis granuli]